MKKILVSLAVLLIASFLFQGFQCASKEMTSAKMKYEQKDYKTAIENLQIELARNPLNDEALLLLARIRMEQGDLREAASIILDAEEKSTNPKYQDQFPKYKNQLWVGSYNKGIEYYQSYFSTQDLSNLDSAIYYFEIGSILRPTLLDFYFLRGTSAELKGDTAKFISSYESYVEGLTKELEYSSANKFQINMNIDDVISKLAKKTRQRIDTLSNGDINRIDVLSTDEEIYLYSKYNKDLSQFDIKGWRLGFPKDWLEGEKFNFFEIRPDIFFALSEYFYKNRKLEQALAYLEKYQKIDPMNNNSNSSIIQIYKELGKEDVALKKLEALTVDEPGNPLYWTMWADMLANLDRYEDAIPKYEKALEINPAYDFALRNLGSSYKNKAVKIQVEEQEKLEKDKKYEIQVDRYFPLLEKSSEYFEKAFQTEAFKKDYMILIELANNYVVLGNKNDERLKKVMIEIEKIEFKVPEEERLNFYLKWLKIASDMKDNQRVANLQRKINLLEEGK